MLRRSHNNGFTLIELLVVLAIISVLTAILFPAFASARDKARQAACLSNEKQMGLAVLQYAQDNDEIIVPYNTSQTVTPDPTTGYQRMWCTILQPYIKNGENDSTIFNVKDADASGVFKCPSFTLQKLVQGTDDPTCDGPGYAELIGADAPALTFADYGIASFGYNGGYPGPAQYADFPGASGDGTQGNPYSDYPGSGPMIQYDDSGNGTYIGFFNLPLSAVKRPSETIMIGDGWTGYPNSGSPYANFPGTLFGCEGAQIHAEGGNYLFMDGHAKYVKGSLPRYEAQDADGLWYMKYLTYDK